MKQLNQARRLAKTSVSCSTTYRGSPQCPCGSIRNLPRSFHAMNRTRNFVPQPKPRIALIYGRIPDGYSIGNLPPQCRNSTATQCLGYCTGQASSNESRGGISGSCLLLRCCS